MKLFELFDANLADGNVEDQNAERQEAIALIKKDCQPFLKQCGGLPLYRGMLKKGLHLKNRVRQDREPTDTSPFLHYTADDWFKEKFGINARGAAMFTTGNYKIASYYGGNLEKVFAVFPIGEFKFIWSPKVRDLYMSSETLLFKKGERVKNDDILKSRIEDWLDSKEYTDSNLPEAIASKKEVMIACQEYYAVLVDSPAAGRKLMKQILG